MEEWREKYDDAYAQTYVLAVRVQDEQIRTLVGAFRDYAQQSKDAAIAGESAMARAIYMDKAIDQANTRIGEVLRSLY